MNVPGQPANRRIAEVNDENGVVRQHSGVEFFLADQPLPEGHSGSGTGTVIIVGDKSNLEALEATAWVGAKFVPAPSLALAAAVARTLRPGRDSGASAELWVPAGAGEGEGWGAVDRTLRPGRDSGASAELWVPAGAGGGEGEGGGEGPPTRVVLCALPTDCARHNSPARPHAVTQLVAAAAAAGADRHTAVLLPGLAPDRAVATAAAVARAFPLYSRKSGGGGGGGPARCVNVVFPPGGLFSGGTGLPRTAVAVAAAVRRAAAWVDMPAEEANVDFLLARAAEVASETGATLQVIRGEALREGGYGGLWGVGKAAAQAPALAVLSRVPEGAAGGGGGVALVGKGIVYDTGGLSLKTKDGMPGMKRDMGGAAALLEAFGAYCAVAGAAPAPGPPVHCLLCLAENSVSEGATRPDDILQLYSGKTVEINNTDAEGRLVLGDGVAHAVAHLQPSVILDMATLTGAQGISTGKRIASLYCNDEALERLVTEVGRSSGDLCHPMPFCPEFYRDEFKSAVADMKNSVKDRANAQVSCAAQFIGNHLGDFLYSGRWVHVDMAYPSYAGERATGFGVALVVELLQRLSEEKEQG